MNFSIPGRRCWLVCVLFVIFSVFSVFGQEKKTFSLGVLAEANANTRHGYALAGGLMMDYGFTDRFALGLKGDVGSDFYNVVSWEALMFGRFYLLNNTLPFNIFLQVGAGGIGLYEEDGNSALTVLGDGAIGIRFPIKKFYVEQYLRFGWPTGFGFGIAAGYRFGSKRGEKVDVVVPEYPIIAENDEPVFEVEIAALPDVGEIIFRANYADFAGKDVDPRSGLDDAVIESNMKILRTVAALMVINPDYVLLIEGFANPVLGTRMEEEYTLVPLSRNRAVFVKDELVKIGADSERISVFGAGSRGAQTDATRNRRVQFIFQKKGKPGTE
jgi:hypothetical protein